jgi:hypothetical protein
MQIETRYGRYWDMQAVSQANILNRLDDSPMKSWGTYWLIDRLSKLAAGRIIATRDHRSVEKRIQEVDPNLRLRWEFDHPESRDDNPIYGMYAVDRFIPELGYHWTLCYWSHRLGDGVTLSQILREGDMQRPEYHRGKKATQELALETQKKRRAEMALEAIDQLSDKQLKNMIEVETALRTGEKIHVRGKDAEMLNRMYENTKKLDAMGFPGIPGSENAINPGMDPIAGYNRGFHFGK